MTGFIFLFYLFCVLTNLIWKGFGDLGTLVQYMCECKSLRTFKTIRLYFQIYPLIIVSKMYLIAYMQRVTIYVIFLRIHPNYITFGISSIVTILFSVTKRRNIKILFNLLNVWSQHYMVNEHQKQNQENQRIYRTSLYNMNSPSSRHQLNLETIEALEEVKNERVGE